MKGSLGDKARIQHIFDAILEIESYLKDKDYTEFDSNSMIQNACIRQLEIIGEAANHLSPWFKGVYSEINWREIVDLRNILIHEYFGIDTKIIWEIIQIDIKTLKLRIQNILNQL